MEQLYINHLAVISCAVLSLVVGGLWYSPLLFARAWQKEAGLSDEQLKKMNPAKAYGITFILATIMSYNLAFFLGNKETDWQWGLVAGLLAGFGWAALMFCVIALFEQRSFRYMLINGGYMIVWFALSGLLLGAWR